MARLAILHRAQRDAPKGVERGTRERAAYAGILLLGRGGVGECQERQAEIPNQNKN
ncbi:hypothetical protein D3C78_1759180 [compost metagenome]